MKKLTTVLATILVTATSAGGVTAYAAEGNKDFSEFERPAISETVKNFKFCMDSEMLQKFEKHEWEKLSEEEKAEKLENMKASMAEKLKNLSDEEKAEMLEKMKSVKEKLPLDGDRFQKMKEKLDDLPDEERTEMLEKMKSAKEKLPLDGDRFQKMKEKLDDLSDEERAEMLEKMKENVPEGKPAFQKAGGRMMSKAFMNTEDKA